MTEMKHLMKEYDLKKRAHAKVKIDLKKFEAKNLKEEERKMQ